MEDKASAGGKRSDDQVVVRIAANGETEITCGSGSIRFLREHWNRPVGVAAAINSALGAEVAVGTADSGLMFDQPVRLELLDKCLPPPPGPSDEETDRLMTELLEAEPTKCPACGSMAWSAQARMAVGIDSDGTMNFLAYRLTCLEPDCGHVWETDSFTDTFDSPHSPKNPIRDWEEELFHE